MDITLHTIPIRKLVAGFENNEEEGVVGFHGKLNIRPKYQREFVYDEKQKQAVIDTIFKNFPLNVMYWVLNEDGTYELLDGQQRTLSICSYFAGEFFVNVDNALKAFTNLTPDQRERFLDYQLQIYICENGTDQEKLDWFRIINIAGERLTEQELLNAVYCGTWVTEAKRKFSKNKCVAYKLAENGGSLMAGSPIRQDYLETVLDWISNGQIEAYMAAHQHDENADIEWQYFQRVVAWVRSLFPKYRKEMKGLPWGLLYNQLKDKDFSATKLEAQVAELMKDEDVTNKRGIYEYVLTGNERKLSIRAFTDRMKREAYERQAGICAHCGMHFALEEMEADHITPWSEGGQTIASNCQMLCRDCNRRKSNK